MRKIFFLTLLAILGSNTAVAERTTLSSNDASTNKANGSGSSNNSGKLKAWMKLGTSDGSNFYVDPASIVKSGNKVTMWSLLDYKEAKTFEGLPYMSLKAQGEYDCEKEQLRVIAGTRQSEAMGAGDAISSISEPSEWNAVAPNGVGRVFWNHACEKR